MAFSSSVPFLVAHQHSATPGDGGTLSDGITIVSGVTMAERMRMRAFQMFTGITGIDDPGQGSPVAIAIW